MSLTVQGTDYVLMPVGTTGQRPATPAAGMTRFNSTTGLLEYYNGTTWLNTGAYAIDYLVVAGGGGAGGNGATGGGGGGGGFLLGSNSFVTSATAYAITVQAVVVELPQ